MIGSDKLRLQTSVESGCVSGMLDALIGYGGMFFWALLLSVITAYFPDANLAWLWIFGIVAMLASPFACVAVMVAQRVWIEEDGVCVVFGQKPVWGIAASQLQFVALVGTEMGGAICFSSRSIEELARLQERKLLKNWFSRDEVPLRKRTGDWQVAFAREYLLREQKKSLLVVCRPKGLIMIPADSTLLACICALYPHLPYYGMSSVGKVRIGLDVPTRIPNMWRDEHHAHLQSDGIRVTRYKKQVGFLPADQIKTIIPIDDYYHRIDNSYCYRPALLACTLTVEELVEMAPKKLFGAEMALLPLDQEMKASACGLEWYRRWTTKDLRACPLQDTEFIRKQLQRYYLNAHWVDISANRTDRNEKS